MTSEQKIQEIMQIAIDMSIPEILEIYIKDGIIPDQENIKYACRIGRTKIIRLLLDYDIIPEHTALDTANDCILGMIEDYYNENNIELPGYYNEH